MLVILDVAYRIILVIIYKQYYRIDRTEFEYWENSSAPPWHQTQHYSIKTQQTGPA